ncbi:MAG: cobyric acid synthase [Nitrospiraceae bacterium]|nr:cobyric acid synthase [Nitrospiraceae bacterium]
MSRALMILGTGSGAGKSLIAAALCRIFSDMGINTAPFKAQNMALNSFVTADGGEIGRAQALQAEAARIEPTTDMNPVLLKASGEIGSQVVIHGRVHSTMKAREYYAFKDTAWEAVTASYNRLAKKHDLIVMEGAGSPAEINLMSEDIVNIRAAKHAKAPAILVGDIDKGGVFASLYGTVKLLGRDAKVIKGFLINKFRGDMSILEPGLKMISELTKKPVLGVLPYIHEIGLPEEDGLALNQRTDIRRQSTEGRIGLQQVVKIVVVRLRYISNFTDFDALGFEPDVHLIYSTNPSDIESADILIIPGSKNTAADLALLKETGLDQSVINAYKKGVQVIGICGGYQMLGKRLLDPDSIESNQKEMDGIGLLDIVTTFSRKKTTRQVDALLCDNSIVRCNSAEDKLHLRGYEIHMGESSGSTGLFSITPLGSDDKISDGAFNHNCWGTYIHGIFDNDAFRRAVINKALAAKGIAPLASGINYLQTRDAAINRLASCVKENIDMDYIRKLVKL